MTAIPAYIYVYTYRAIFRLRTVANLRIFSLLLFIFKALHLFATFEPLRTKKNFAITP